MERQRKLAQHPLSALFPPMPDDEYQALVEDIRQHGVLEPVTVYEGKVMDGWHRYRAATEAGVQCPTREWANPDGPESAFAYVWSKNTLRRHLTSGQRIAVTAKGYPDLWEKVNTANPGPANPGDKEDILLISPAEKLASIAGVHPRSVQDAKRIERDRPDLWEQVEGGRKALGDAINTRLYEQVLREQTVQQARRQAQDVDWQNDYVKDRLTEINRLQQIKLNIHIGLEEKKFAPEAKPFIVRRINRAIVWLTEAKNELEES
jgi:hypothetical protein